MVNFFGWKSRRERGLTQGYLVSLNIFNIVVNAVVIAVMLEVCAPHE